MGLFLADPLVEELTAAAATTSPLSNARRVLEVMVPLVYRPAMKVDSRLLTFCTSQGSTLRRA